METHESTFCLFNTTTTGKSKYLLKDLLHRFHTPSFPKQHTLYPDDAQALNDFVISQKPSESYKDCCVSEASQATVNSSERNSFFSTCTRSLLYWWLHTLPSTGKSGNLLDTHWPPSCPVTRSRQKWRLLTHSGSNPKRVPWRTHLLAQMLTN